MGRHCYKAALRVKGIRPIPRDPLKLRSSLNPVAEDDQYIDATMSALKERYAA